jgi:SHS2 domain-containing protein
VSSEPAQSERGYRALDHTADRAIEAWAPDLRELFRAAAEGMFSESVSCAGIEPEREWQIQVEAGSLEGLLHAWLSELIWVSERDEVRVEPHGARGRAWGGSAPPDMPHTGAPVKAVTYHDLRVWEEGGVWRAHLVFDV